MAKLKKGVYSLPFLTDCLRAANPRYIEFISGFDNQQIGRKKLEHISESIVEK
jgi:hypothetical protein